MREQIEMRVIGLGMVEHATVWSSSKDESVGTVEYLRNVLKQILVDENTLRRDGELPEEAVPPVLKVKTLKTLGTPTAHALELQQTVKLGAEQLKTAALAEQRRRIEAGITDDVADVMPIEAPELNNELVGCQLEVCWGTYYLEGKRVKMWCPCKVMRVADGVTDTGRHAHAPPKKRSKTILKAGALLVEWEPDAERGEEEATLMWLVLASSKWNKDGHLAWRWHPDELGPPAKRARRM